MILFILILGIVWVTLWGSTCSPGKESQPQTKRCYFDGTSIRDLYRVEIVQNDQKKLTFCSLYCAVQWLALNKDRAGQIRVVDETSGRLIDSKQAFYVASKVISVPEVKNNIHVFALKEAALAHTRQFGGQLITNPF
ncbi:MAG: hypothetical protein V2B13_18920 [Pseudomonadota bacterium]